MCHEVLEDVRLFSTVIKNILIDENRCVITLLFLSVSIEVDTLIFVTKPIVFL